MSKSNQDIIRPLSIILVKKGSKGDRLLFRYPFKGLRCSEKSFNDANARYIGGTPMGNKLSTQMPSSERNRKLSKSASPMGSVRANISALRSVNENVFYDGDTDETGGISHEGGFGVGNDLTLKDLSNSDLANLLAVNTELSEKKFELKINQLRFVGHPTLMVDPNIPRFSGDVRFPTSVSLFHVAFCLDAMADHSIVRCYYELSKKLGLALRHEQSRCGFLVEELKLMIHTFDDDPHIDLEENQIKDGESIEKTFEKVLDRSRLAKLLKQVYEDVYDTGYTFVRINDWVQVSFCLPQRIHFARFRDEVNLINPQDIYSSLDNLRPYHAILLLVEKDHIMKRLTIDSSSTIMRLLQVYSPLKSLQTLAADADLTLSHIVEVASHLVYWGFASIIYPLCEANVYVISKDIRITSPELSEEFLKSFPHLSLVQVMSDFSQPMSLADRCRITLGGSYMQQELIELVKWLLSNRLLTQLHTYVYMTASFMEDVETSLGHQTTETEVKNQKIELNESDLEYLGGEFEAMSDRLLLESYAGPGESRVTDKPLSELSEYIFLWGSKYQLQDDNVQFRVTSSALNTTLAQFQNIFKSPPSLNELKAFFKLCHYFNGECHLEEIMYRENIRRSQLMLLLDKFQDLIILVEKEDQDVNFFIHN